MTKETMKLIRRLVDPIPSSPYAWKMTSEKSRNAMVQAILEQREAIAQMALRNIIDGELDLIQDDNPKQVFAALRSIKKVMMEKYVELKA